MGIIAGIELGMNYSSLAVLNEQGKPEIVPDFSGNRVIPSVVAFNGGNSVTVGLDAKNKLSTDPTDVVQCVLRKMGDPSHRYLVGGAEYSPVQILAFILKKLKDDCVQNGAIKDVVITVPAHFAEIERKSVMDAGEIAGLNVLGLVNEPTAAAVYYASQTSISGNVVVYDLGASAFDVSILRMKHGQVETLASKGNGHLGGVDFDKLLARRVANDAKRDWGVELFPDHFFETFPRENSAESRTYFEVMQKAEIAKKAISTRGKGTIRGRAECGDFATTILASDFEEMISFHLMTTEMLLENALEDAGLSASDIDKVLLVGGSTRIPKVSQMLESFFGFAPEKSINPSEAVVLGAAIIAGKRKLNSTGLSAALRSEVNQTLILECANKFFGILTLGLNEARGEMMMQNEILIRRGSLLPCSARRLHQTTIDDQRQIIIEVTESEEETHDPEHVHKIGSWILKLPPNCPKGAPFHVNYGYDIDQRLTISVEMPGGGRIEAELSYNDDGDLGRSKMQREVAKLDDFLVE